MKLQARQVPFSSVVGSGLTLYDEKGRAAFIVNFMGTTQGITREQTEAMSAAFTDWVNEFGLEVPERKQ
jgi:uncharacterized protein YecA (UPF0149 family)